MPPSQKSASVFDDLKKNMTPDAYIIQGSCRSRHIFRHLPASEKWHNLQTMAKNGELARIFPKAPFPEPYLGCDELVYEQAAIGQCDDDGMVRTTNKEHAKLIYKEYRECLDPKARVHPLSLQFDVNEPVDESIANWQPAEQAASKASETQQSGGGSGNKLDSYKKRD